MKLGRRGFLRALGIALAALIADSAGVASGAKSVLGYASIGSALFEDHGGPIGGSDDKNEGGVSHARKIATWLATRGLLDYVLDRVRDQVKGNVNRFDPDLVVNRSFSLSWKPG
jgi:hypothetical protein